MAYVTLPDFTTNEILTSAIMQQVSDDMDETAVAKAVAAGDLFQATGLNALARLAIGTDYQALISLTGVAKWSSSLSAAMGFTDLVNNLRPMRHLYSTLPVMQFGLVTTGSTSAGSFYDFTYPVAFKTGTVPVVLAMVYETVAGDQINSVISNSTATLHRFNWNNNGNARAVKYFYLAIGEALGT